MVENIEEYLDTWSLARMEREELFQVGFDLDRAASAWEDSGYSPGVVRVGNE